MDIKAFISILLVLAIGAYFIPVENKQKNSMSKDIPLAIFEKPLMYTLDENGVNRVVNASSAVRYKNRDEMFNADINLKNKDLSKKFLKEKLKADIIIKKIDLYRLIDNVKYARDDFMTLNTNELYYDDKKKIGYNKKPFDGTYFAHYMKGNSIYFDVNKKFMKAKDTHFEIDMNKKGKK